MPLLAPNARVSLLALHERVSLLARNAALAVAALPALGRFALGAPRVDPAAVALHRLVSGRAPWPSVPSSSSLAALAERAKREQVAVLVAALAPETAPWLADTAARLRHVDALLELACADVARALGDRFALALMKGSAAASWVYTASAERQRRDLDVLVGDALPEVRRVLREHGWQDRPDPRLPADPARVRAWDMAKTLGHVEVHVDLHRSFVEFDWCRPDAGAMLAARVPGRAPLPVTSPADTFVNTAVHLLQTGFHEPLKGWVDLLRLAPLIAPAELATRARRHRLATGTWLCLGVLARWFGADVAAHRAALGRPPQGALLEHLAAGEHATPERAPLPRGVSYRLWPRLVRDVGAAAAAAPEILR